MYAPRYLSVISFSYQYIMVFADQDQYWILILLLIVLCQEFIKYVTLVQFV